MRLNSILPALILVLFFQPAKACELLDAATAQNVLGTAVTDLSSDPKRFCLFLSPETSAQLFVQTDPVEYYDKITIQKPHKEELDIGDRARSHVFSRGGAAIQFISGDVSVTLGVRAPAGDNGRDYLTLLKAAAKTIAIKLD